MRIGREEKRGFQQLSPLADRKERGKKIRDRGEGKRRKTKKGKKKEEKGRT